MNLEKTYNKYKKNLFSFDSQYLQKLRKNLISNFNLDPKKIKNNESLKHFDTKLINNFIYKPIDKRDEFPTFDGKYKSVINIKDNSKTAEIPDHDGLLTCPPYWNLEKYDDENGLDRIKKWADFLKEYECIWKRVIDKALPGSKYCIVLGDWRKKGIYYDFVFQTEKIMEKLGMKPFDKVILSHKKQAKIKIMLPQVKRLGYTVKVHQILLVFEKM